jgi:hypothetical protein
MFTPGGAHGVAVHDNRMWVLGGVGGNSSGGDYNDAWYSFDGINWTQAATGSQFERDGAFAASINGRLSFLFGLNMTMVADVWSAVCRRGRRGRRG